MLYVTFKGAVRRKELISFFLLTEMKIWWELKQPFELNGGRSKLNVIEPPTLVLACLSTYLWTAVL